ncbi:ATP phosphoribosyltransferase regulatory subunit [Rhizobium sp. Leaf384]|uniref:ATP phosphoribosyltransferase regulatory subunit n=1 Tax=unclassified Rhizobium TaxID=2613769 RepID=UPI000715AFFE|nr:MULTISPECIES: ATP phosphoribosyltransferase regulatory subunit [unclassified Rhizobium]KQS77277.1 ATP phosphoribosyltransferase regulatory subunit [Rhizobium sp. Leaf383]KQS80800.1 ATP phosphoribosyltransferase regulatory subunit [Rhizobium sp. Leaf384]
MTLSDMPDFAPDLLAAFTARGAVRVHTPVIQPADPFLDMAGEDLRRRIFLTTSETGTSLCLRPEFTIPVCLRHIATATGTPRRYAYLGEVFRQRRGGAEEFYQAGIEDLGERDVAGADARAIVDAMDMVRLVLPGDGPGRHLRLTLGDQAVFEAVVAALGLPVGWQKRLIHAFGDAGHLEALLERLARPQPVAGLDPEIEALLAADRDDDLIAWLEQRMEQTGYSTNASRSPAEIARRLKEKRALAATRLDGSALLLLREFLTLRLPLAEASAALAGFADAADLKLGPAMAAFDARLAALSNAGADLSAMTYRAAFGRPLDYYTGMVFEITATRGDVLAGGGRFDRLMTLLGAESHIPAVGFSLWLDRIETQRLRTTGEPA